MKKEKQLTVVEWFLENLRNLIKESELTDMRPSEFDVREMELLEQAKEMEKEKIKEMKFLKFQRDVYIKDIEILKARLREADQNKK
jgi:hypothetical protein